MKKAFLITLMLIVGTTWSGWADDTEIYGTVTNPDLEPNILIIFDSSGSMSTVDVPGDPYDSTITYPDPISPMQCTSDIGTRRTKFISGSYLHQTSMI